MTRPRNTESDRERASDEGLVGVLIRSPTFLWMDVAAGKFARRDVKRKWFVKLSRVEWIHPHTTLAVKKSTGTLHKCRAWQSSAHRELLAVARRVDI